MKPTGQPITTPLDIDVRCGVGLQAPAYTLGYDLAAASNAAADGAFIVDETYADGWISLRPGYERHQDLTLGGRIGDIARWSVNEHGVSAFLNAEEGVSVIGGAGDDFIAASQGSNVIEGGGGRDRLIGGRGDDTLIASSGGFATLTGGDGADTFQVLGDALIADFQPGVDKLVIGHGDGYDAVFTFAVEPTTSRRFDHASGAWSDVVLQSTTVTTLDGRKTVVEGVGIDQVVDGLATTMEAVYGQRYGRYGDALILCV